MKGVKREERLCMTSVLTIAVDYIIDDLFSNAISSCHRKI